MLDSRMHMKKKGERVMETTCKKGLLTIVKLIVSKFCKIKVYGVHRNASFNTKYVVLFSFKHSMPCLVGGQVCSSLYSKVKNATEGNNDTCELFQLEHPPLASNRGTQLHTKKCRRGW